MKEIKIGIVVADSDEYKTLKSSIEKGEYEQYNFLGRDGHSFIISNGENKAKVISLLCGIGKVNAAAAATHLVDIGCDVILNYGLSGGISGISRGEICVPDKFLEHDFDLSGIGYKLCEKPNQEYIYSADIKLLEKFKHFFPQIKYGTAVSGDSFICDKSVRERLKENFGAMSCDMETAAIAYVCSNSKTPFLALRRISDDAGEDAVDNYRSMNVSDEAVLSDLLLEFINEIIVD